MPQSKIGNFLLGGTVCNILNNAHMLYNYSNHAKFIINFLYNRRGSKTNQQKTMKVPHLKQPPSPGPVNPFKKPKNEQQSMIDAMSEANKKKTVKRQSLCHLSDDDDDDDDDFKPNNINIKKK